MSQYEQLIKHFFDAANVDYQDPNIIQIYNDQFYKKVFLTGSLGLGEAYMDGWWDSPCLDEVIFKLTRYLQQSNTHTLTLRSMSFSALANLTIHKIFNYQAVRKAFEVGRKHYDIGNDLFQNMLDSRMIYSCAYWKNATDLEEAQRQKLDLICKKLQLAPGMRLLDIGCGWGGLAEFAAKNYGVSVVGVTISVEQKKYADIKCKDLPVEIFLQDYRLLQGQFDRVVSVGMMEHVGYKNYRTYMKVANRCLQPEGLFLVQVVGSNVTNYATDPWVDKYVFPNALSPSIKQIGAATENLLMMEDWQNFGPYYDKTLMAWYDNFTRHWDVLKDRYDERFYRLWKFYLLAAAGLSRARHAQLWQMVFSKSGIVGGYTFYR